MNAERARAYGRVMKTVEDLSATKLHRDEQQVIRDAADTLLFSEGDDGEATVARRRLGELLDRLVDSDRVAERTAEAIAADVEGCGPEPVPTPA